MRSINDHLIRRKEQMVLLLTPPFDQSKPPSKPYDPCNRGPGRFPECGRHFEHPINRRVVDSSCPAFTSQRPGSHHAIVDRWSATTVRKSSCFWNLRDKRFRREHQTRDRRCVLHGRAALQTWQYLTTLGESIDEHKSPRVRSYDQLWLSYRSRGIERLM